MTKDEALRLALEALEEMQNAIYNIGGEHAIDLNFAIEQADVSEFAITAIKAALEAKDEPVAIKWEKDADKECHYNNWVGITPFGKILITWKGWKEYHDACVDEFPGGFEAYGLPDDVKAACEVEYLRRLYTTLPQQEAKDEPVAWISPTELLVMRGNALGGAKDWRVNVGLKPEDGDVGLYTTPPQRRWAGLTDEEISELIRETHNTGSFVRAIEAKLKQKNFKE